jgi:hypothetical protein
MLVLTLVPTKQIPKGCLFMVRPVIHKMMSCYVCRKSIRHHVRQLKVRAGEDRAEETV